ncbi:hypothetical protein [uncultured Treponema sp.]|nr:hypothetical protein [uncultured Treponema sp.]
MAREFQIYKVGAKKIMKTNDFYKIINDIESFFEKEAMILLSRK